jgi:hypothetical protein
LPGTVFLDKVQRDAHQHDDANDDKAGDILGDRGDDARGQEDKYEWIAETGEEFPNEQSPAVRT